MFLPFRKPEERYLTFTFDDGYILGARKIDKILHPYKATFYLVTGWVRPNNLAIRDEYNIGADHGNVEDWKELVKKGHDIGSHSVSHTRPDDFSGDAEALKKEFAESLEFIKKIHPGPYSLSFPYNRAMEIDALYDSVRLGYAGCIYNRLESVDLHRITSWSPWPGSMWEKRIFWKIGRLPGRSWLVLNLHSVDGEGWHPWTSASLQKLKDYVLARGFEIKTMAEMTRILLLKSSDRA